MVIVGVVFICCSIGENFTMVGKLLLVLCAVASISQVYTNASDVNDIQLAFRKVINQIRSTDIPSEAVRFVFPNPEQTSATLTDLLKTKSSPEVSEIMDVFNYNFGARLLVVNGDYVQVDPSNYQRFLSDHALRLVRSVYPKDFFQQLVLYGILQRQIKQTCQIIRPEIESRRIPVQDVNALIASNGHRISKRNASDTDFVSDLISSLGNTICNDLVGVAFAQLNNTLSSVSAFLDSISIEGGSSAIPSLIADLVNLGVSLAKQLITGLTEIAESLTSNVCSDLLGSSRKRRELPAELVDRSNINTALADSMARDVAFGNILGGLYDIVWGLISGLINTSLTSLVSALLTTIESRFDQFLESTLGSFLNGLIASIFPA